MKIRKLTIKNVASIEAAELDFEHGALGEAPLFLICGETGSGKTTILDCITLALYGKTPRYNDKKTDNDCQIGGYPFNDVRQLVRRGATSASAKLEIIGNDGRPYVAEWSVEAVSKGANKGTLKKEIRSWKDCSEGGMTWTGTTECNAVVLRVVGLGFDQFCRTTMLAQGQFTKFMLGTEDEKAEILEKLTDTSKYTELGKAIAAKYGALDDDVEMLEAEIAKMSGLGERRAQVEARVNELKGIIAELEKKRSATEAKAQWLQRRQELADNVENVKSEFVGTFAALKALERRTETDIADAKAELDELKRYLESNAEKASMLENAAVILANLVDVRNARQRKKQAEAALAQCQQTIPEQTQKVQAAQAALESAVQQVAAAEGVVAAEEQTLEGMNLRQVQAEKSEAEKLRGNLQGLVGSLKGIEALKASVSAREVAVAEKRQELARHEAELPEKKKAMEQARTALVQVQKDEEDQKKLIDNGIEKLVSDLNVGDVCPICGHRIEQLQAKESFRELFEKLKARCAQAREAAEDKERQYNVAMAAVNELRSTIESEAERVEQEKTQVDRDLAAVAEVAARCGVKDATLESVDVAIQDCGRRIQALDAKLDEIEKQNRKLNELRKELRQLERAKESAKAEVDRAEKALANSQGQIEKLGVSIQTEADRATSKLDEAKGRISIEGWLDAWENDAVTAEAELRSTAAAYVARKAKRPTLEAKLVSLEQEGGRIAESIARAVGKLAALAEVGPGTVVAKSTAAVEGLLGRLEECESACRRQLELRPEGLEPTDTVEKLGEAVAAIKAEFEKSADEHGRCQQQLADDDRCAEERGKMCAAKDRLVAERDEWHPIYNYFGDNSGKKIKLEIQSYVLMNVLVKANYYLRQLSGRYALSCEGLMLSVVDAFDGEVVRPVNTLSGGEQFLVSLALALGLAGMGEAGLCVDMLLIDEGFGTLSGEHLNSAIEALERLNALTGTRKVGVISHVERLRERIHTHVEVTRNGHDPSTIRVVTGAGV